MAASAFTIVFPALMAFAAFSDLLTFRIPNNVSVGLIVGYFVAAILFAFPPQTIGLDLLCALSVFALSAALFSFDLIGGGDAKLASASALWLGWSNLLTYGVVASIIGGVLTVMIVLLRFYDLPKFVLLIGVVGRLADKSNGVPYGVALALAGLNVYPQTAIWSHLASLTTSPL